ncbi:MAG: hypothetical protein ABH934_04100 [Chloroflexota bacterium]
MAIHYSNGTGQLHTKETKQTVAQINYRLTETDPTKYTKKKWWGEFSASKELKELKESIIFRIEFEDGRDGDCAVWANTETQDDTSSKHHHNYHFNGRGKMGQDFRSGK